MKLRDALRSMQTADLRGVAFNLQIPTALTALRNELAEVVEKSLCDEATLTRLLAGLDPPQRAAVEALVVAGGRMRAAEFHQRFGRLRFSQPYRYGEQERWTHPTSPAEALYFRGLIFRGYGDQVSWRGEFIGIPDEILSLLPQKQRTPIESILVPVSSPRVIVPTPDIVRDICVLLCCLQRETVRPLRSGGLAKRDILRLQQDMSVRASAVADLGARAMPLWLELVDHLARLLGLVQTTDDRLVPSPQGEAWLRHTRHEQITDLWRRFVADTTWAEPLPLTDGDAATLYPMPAAAAVRTQLRTLLSRCPPHRWFLVSSLEQAIQEHLPLIVRNASLHLVSPMGISTIGESDWDAAEGPILRQMLAQSFAAFGVISLGADDEQGTNAAFRITETGTILLGMEKGTISDPQTAPITVQPNFDVVVPAETPPPVLYFLQQVAKVAKSDRASVYVLSRDLIWQHLQTGGSIDGVIAFLEKASGRELPQNVAYSLRDWAARYGELAIEPAILLTASSDALLAEVRANRKLRLKTAAVLSPRAVTLAEPDLPALVERLRKAGYSPKIAQDLAAPAAPESHNPSVQVPMQDIVMLLAHALAAQYILEEHGLSVSRERTRLLALARSLPPAKRRRIEEWAIELYAHYHSADGQEGSSTSVI